MSLRPILRNVHKLVFLISLLPTVLSYRTSGQTDFCRECIDDENQWCPSINRKYGFCCKNEEDCPRTDLCSQDFPGTAQSYQLCPNKFSCKFDRKITPPISGHQIYEVLELDDLCAYQVSMPKNAQPSDTMFIRVERLTNAQATLVRGQSL